MPKPMVFETMEAPAVPQAAQAAPAKSATVQPANKQSEIKREPLQVRWPKADVKAAKRAALEADQTVSDFMLACFHACMKNAKKD
jgi:hypothetical protein